MSASHKLRIALRKIAVAVAVVLPDARRRRIERYLRGRQEFKQLERADIVVVSFGKSGRTWLRVLISRYYQLRHRLPADRLLDDDSLHRLEPAVPRVLFTHDNYPEDYAGRPRLTALYAKKRVVFLVRHPADTAVSQYFQWKFRMKPRKKLINAYPEAKSGLPLIDFVLDEVSGIPKVVRFMNRWADDLGSIGNVLVVRYETLKDDTVGTLGRILRFLGEEPSPADLAECAAFASVDNMRQLEKTAFFKEPGGRLKPGDAANPESFKVRRAKAGGYRDDFAAADLARIDALIAARLAPLYGYCGSVPAAQVI